MEHLSDDGALRVSDLFSFLEGDWQLSRLINDLRQNMPGEMTATATLTKRIDSDGNPGLSYREEGELHFGDYRETVYRAYDFSFPEPHRARVHFSDGNDFHELDLSTGYCEAEYLCGEDLYRGRFQVLSGDVWLSNWTVHGPSKELVLDNRYRRLI